MVEKLSSAPRPASCVNIVVVSLRLGPGPQVVVAARLAEKLRPVPGAPASCARRQAGEARLLGALIAADAPVPWWLCRASPCGR